MTPPKKPDWMEIADGDDQVPAVAIKKRRPLVIAMMALLVTLGGVVVAQTHQESPASADEVVTPQSSQSATAATQAVSPAAPSNSANPSAPAIATPPTMKDGEDGERKGRGEHEGRGERDGGNDDFEEH